MVDYVYARNQHGEEQDYKKVTRVFVREKSILIHVVIDGETIITTEEHLFYIEGDGFVEASELEVGDLAETADGDTIAIDAVEVEYLEEPVTVYNFEVEDYHTYYVGDAEVLVHNTCMVGESAVKRVGEAKYQVGAYKDIKGVVGLDAHHAGQKATMKKLVDGYDPMTAPAINVPKVGHTIKGHNGIVSRSTKGITSARQLLARDIKELRRVYPDIPNSKLQELIDMNKKLYPEMRK